MVTLALSGRRRSRCIFVQFRVAALKAPFVSKPHPVIGTLAEEVSVFYMGAWVFVRLCGSTSTIEAGSTCHTRTALEISQETSQVGMKQEGGDRWWLTEFEFPPQKKQVPVCFLQDGGATRIQQQIYAFLTEAGKFGWPRWCRVWVRSLGLLRYLWRC